MVAGSLWTSDRPSNEQGYVDHVLIPVIRGIALRLAPPASAAAGLQHWKLTRTGTEREGLVYPCKLGFSQAKVSGPRIFGSVFRIRRLWDGKGRWTPHEESQGDLASGRVVCLCNFLQHAAALRPRTGETPMPERCIADYRDAMLLAPWHHGVLNRALLQMIEHLIADERTITDDLSGLFKVGLIEVADAPG